MMRLTLSRGKQLLKSIQGGKKRFLSKVRLNLLGREYVTFRLLNTNRKKEGGNHFISLCHVTRTLVTLVTKLLQTGQTLGLFFLQGDSY